MTGAEMETNQIMKCPSCGQRARKHGKAIRSGKELQRYQCTNRECKKFGVMQTLKENLNTNFF